MKLFDYECQTTFWEDFTTAERSGIPGIRDTYKRVIAECAGNAVYLTELCVVLNCKIDQWYDGNRRRRTEIARVYSELWKTASEYAETHLTGEDLAYYYKTTD